VPTQPWPVSSKLLEQIKCGRIFPQFRRPLSQVIFFLKQARVIAVLKSDRKDIVPGLTSGSLYFSRVSNHKHSAAYISSTFPTIARKGPEHPTDRRAIVTRNKVNLNETKAGVYTIAVGSEGSLGSFRVTRVIWELADASIDFRGSLRNRYLLVLDIAKDVFADYRSGREFEVTVPLGVVWISPHVTQDRGSYK